MMRARHRSRRSTKWGVLAALFATAIPMACAETRTVADASLSQGNSFILKAKRVYTGTSGPDWVHAPGVVIVRDGRIRHAGAEPAALPLDLPVITYRDGIVTPGLVAAATWMISEHTGDESIAADYRAIDAFDRHADYQEVLAGGVTTVHLQPGQHRLLTGQGAVVRLGGPMSERVLSDASDLTINLGESAFRPPRDITFQTPASSDVAIPPGIRQRPDSRLGQLLALLEAHRAAETAPSPSGHQAALLENWRRPWRVQTQRGADLNALFRLIEKTKARGYIVGGAEAHLTVNDLRRLTDWSLVYTIGDWGTGNAEDIGLDPDALDVDIRNLRELSETGIPLALAGPSGESPRDLRLAAATAIRGGLSPRQVLEGITRIPAEILGVADRVGSLVPDLEADLVVFSDEPWRTSAHALAVYVKGELAFRAPQGALVIRAGTIWVDDQTQIHHGSVLVENGKIVAAGAHVPHPPFSRVVDAGPRSYVTPGFIDALGHLEFEGDREAAAPELCPVWLLGVPDVTHRRVARAGITTVLLSAYGADRGGSRVSAVKTWGHLRADRVVTETAAVRFHFEDSIDPKQVRDQLDGQLKKAQTYLEKWSKYEKELAEWKEKKSKGQLEPVKPAETVVETVEKKLDPITGTWEVTLSGGPIPEPQNGIMKLRLTGSDVEGRLTDSEGQEEVALTGTFDGKMLRATVDVETPFGNPKIEAELTEEDHLVGTFSVAQFSIDLDARRIDAADVEFKVVRRKTRGKEGEPLPPEPDEELEPLRAVLEKKIPLAVRVGTAAQVDQVLRIAKEFEIPLVLVDAPDAGLHAQRLIERSVGVIVNHPIERWSHDRRYHQADDLARKKIPIAFGSLAEDAARTLPLVGLHAVERGLSPDAALAAFTILPSRMFKLDNRIGSLQPGRDGDLIIFSGHPFEAGSRIERVFIGGIEVE